MWMKKQQHVAGVRCMCVLVCKRDSDEVKNQAANEVTNTGFQNHYPYKLTGVVKHMTLIWVSSFIQQHHPNRVQA